VILLVNFILLQLAWLLMYINTHADASQHVELTTKVSCPSELFQYKQQLHHIWFLATLHWTLKSLLPTYSWSVKALPTLYGWSV
jgi:hypothetical protein